MDTIPLLDQFEAVGGLPLMRCASEWAVDNAAQEGNQPSTQACECLLSFPNLTTDL